jgi:hypothetical protein
MIAWEVCNFGMIVQELFLNASPALDMPLTLLTLKSVFYLITAGVNQLK